MRVVRVRRRRMARDQDGSEWSGRRRRRVQCDRESGPPVASRRHYCEWPAIGNQPGGWYLRNRRGAELRQLQSGRRQRSDTDSCIESDVLVDGCGRRGMDPDPDAERPGERNCFIRGAPLGDTHAQWDDHDRRTEGQRQSIRGVRVHDRTDVCDALVGSINREGRGYRRSRVHLDGREPSTVADDYIRCQRER